MDNPNPSTLEKLIALTGKTAIGLTVAGQIVNIAAVSITALAKFLDSKEAEADLTELDKTHAEYQRRIALAKDPSS